MFSAARTILAASWVGRLGEFVGWRMTSAPCIISTRATSGTLISPQGIMASRPSPVSTTGKISAMLWARQIRIHKIVRGGEGSGIDPPVAQDGCTGRIDQKTGVEITARPLRVALELMATDVESMSAGGRLQRLGDRAGDRAAGLFDPFP